MEPYHEELSNKAWSMWHRHIPRKSFSLKSTPYVIIRYSSWWQKDFLAGPGIYQQNVS